MILYTLGECIHGNRTIELFHGIPPHFPTFSHMAVCQNLVPLVNIKIAGKWMFIPLKMVLIGIDPYPYLSDVLCQQRQNGSPGGQDHDPAPPETMTKAKLLAQDTKEIPWEIHGFPAFFFWFANQWIG